jgi:subtilisin family serine protease
VVSVLFCGSRSFSSFSVVSPPVSRWLAAGGGVVCGSSAGADALVVRSALAAGGASALLVLAAFSSSGAGAASCSSLPSARAAASAGASVVWLAGGPLSLPLRARLAGRTSAAAALASGGVVFSAGGPLGPGSSLAVACLVSRRCPVWLFSPLPSPVRGLAGAWVPSLFCGLPCFRFVPSQLSFDLRSTLRVA